MVFYCPSNGYAISSSSVCNGLRDCPYNEDEENCENYQNPPTKIRELTEANFQQAVTMGTFLLVY